MLGTLALVAQAADKGSDIDVGSIIGFVIVGAIVGVLARFVVPGEDPMGILGTIVLGIVGAVIGGWAAGADLQGHRRCGLDRLGRRRRGPGARVAGAGGQPIRHAGRLVPTDRSSSFRGDIEMIVSWLLRLVAGLVIGKVWRHVSGRSTRPARARIPIRPDREIT